MLRLKKSGWVISGVLILSACGNEKGALRRFSEPAAVLNIHQNQNVDFGTQWIDGNTEKTLTIQNTGDEEATEMNGTPSLSLHFSYKGRQYPGEGGTCIDRLASGASCSIVFVFAPRASGVFEDTLRISYFDGSNKQITNKPLVKGKGAWDDPGVLDITFGVNGYLRTEQRIWSLKIYENNMAVTGSTASNGTDTDWLIQKWTMGGMEESSFGAAGKQWISWGSEDDSLGTITVEPYEGKIVAGGTAKQNGQRIGAIAKLLSQGSFDSSFGNSGRVTFSQQAIESAFQSLALQSDSSIVAVGEVVTSGSSDWLVVQFSKNGVLDTAFGSSGKMEWDFGSPVESAVSIATSGGGIFVVGNTGNSGVEDIVLLKLKSDGSLDASFGNAGKIQWDMSGGGSDTANVIKILDGKIYVGGSSQKGDKQGFVARLDLMGNLDTSFGTGGFKFIDHSSGDDSVETIELQPDKRIIIAGASGQEAYVSRLEISGNPDTRFGQQGTRLFSLASGMNSARALGLQSHGKIVVAGQAPGLLGFLSRFWP